MIKSHPETEKTINESSLNKAIPFQYDTLLHQCTPTIQEGTLSRNLFYLYLILNSRSSSTSQKLMTLELVTNHCYKDGKLLLTELMYYLKQIYRTDLSFNPNELQIIHKLFSFVITELAKANYYDVSRMLSENVLKDLNDKNAEGSNDKEILLNIDRYKDLLLKHQAKQTEFINNIKNADKYF